jgi:anti-sigma factor RsiW
VSAESSTACRETLERISAYLDDELAAPECHAIEAHCRECPPCRTVVEQLRQAVGLCREAGAAPLPEYVRRRARASVRALLSAKKPARPRRHS